MQIGYNELLVGLHFLNPNSEKALLSFETTVIICRSTLFKFTSLEFSLVLLCTFIRHSTYTFGMKKGWNTGVSRKWMLTTASGLFRTKSGCSL